MNIPFNTEGLNAEKFRLLSAASLLNKVRKGMSVEDMYRDAERKFDTLIDLLGDTYSREAEFGGESFTMDDLKRMSLFVFDSLICNSAADPYMTLCVLEDASPREIKRRRNRLLTVFHPDRNWKEFASSMKTKRINEAYNLIINHHIKKYVPFWNTATDIPPVYHCNYPYKRKPYESGLIRILVIAISLIALVGFVRLLF